MFINFHSTKSEGVVIPERDTRLIDIFEYFERIEKKHFKIEASCRYGSFLSDVFA